MQHLYTLYQMINMREAKSIMSKSSNMVYKTLVIGIIVLLIGMSIVSSNGYVIKSNHNYLGNQPCKSGLRDNNDTTPPVTNISLKGNISKYGIFYSNVEVILNATDDQSGVNVTYYDLDAGGDKIYYESFMVTEHGWHALLYYSVDNAGNVEDWKVAYFDIDLIPPLIHLCWDRLDNKSIKFISEVYDDGSGPYKVEYYIDNKYMHTSYLEDYFNWIWDPPGQGHYVASVIVYDKAEHTGWDEIGVDVPRTRTGTYSLFQWFFERYPTMEVLLRIMRLLR